MPQTPKLLRCVRLLEVLHLRGELATRDAAALLGVDTQTARRDLRALQDANVPLEPIGKGSDRRYRLDPGYRQARVRVSVGDALALQLGQQFLEFLDGTAIPTWAADLQAKLRPGLSPRSAELSALLSQRLVFVSEPWRRYDGHGEILDTLIDALLQSQELDLHYQSPNAERWHERLQPLALIIYRRALYLLAQPPDGETQLRFAVDRILEIRERETWFDYPEGYDPRDDLGHAFGLFESGEPEHVHLRFAPKVAPYVRSRVWHETATLIERDDGGVDLKMYACGPELRRLVLEFGETVEVLAPAGLRDAVIQELRGALALYEATEAAGG